MIATGPFTLFNSAGEQLHDFNGDSIRNRVTIPERSREGNGNSRAERF